MKREKQYSTMRPRQKGYVINVMGLSRLGMVYLRRDTYANNGRLAVCIVDKDKCTVGLVTVNLSTPLSAPHNNLAFVDENNLPGIGLFLLQNNIAKPTGNFACSGFCIYPEYEFDLRKFGGSEE